jgi:branched-subunit amino acid transport protein
MMSQSEQLLLVCGMAFVTFMIRYPILALIGRVTLPGWMIEALRYVPLAVLTAIIVPAVFILQDGTFSLVNSRVAACLVAALVMWRSKSLLLTIVVGMAAYLLLQNL